MKYPRPPLRLSLCLAALVAVCGAQPAALALGDDWRPVEASELALKSPVVERDADAEVLFWDVRIDDDQADLVFKHYVRIKVFTDRGRESQSKVDIPYISKFVQIKDVAGRTIKPDGSILELKKDDVFERDIVKASGLKLKAKSFAMPGIEAGSIIEYRWREVRHGVSRYERFDFSRNIPVQFVKYYIKPYGSALFDSDGKPVGLRAQTFHANMTPFQQEEDGFYSTTTSNVPAFREEPHMPPEYAVRPWMLVYYSGEKKSTPDEFWKSHGRRTHERFKGYMKASDDVRKASAETVGDAATPEQKLERLYNFVRARVKRATDDALGLTPEQLAKLEANKSPSDTLKRAVGTSFDIDMLFATMAAAAGFEVRIASTSDRGDIFFDASFTDEYFIDPASVAVRVGEKWHLFNPGSTYVPFGMLRWQEEGQMTLVSDAKEPVWVMSPNSPAVRSLERRAGKFTLADDGTLEGDVRIEYTGHLAADVKEQNDDDSPAAREETLKARFKSRLGDAELTAIRVENVTDPDKPFAYSFHVRVPGYAQRTGKRLFLPAAFFQRGVGPLFPTSARRHSVYFHYFWGEEDRVEISLPEGFTLDNADSPAPFKGGDLSLYEPALQLTKDGRTLHYTRKFYFGGKDAAGSNFFPAESYGQLKTYFDEMHKQDGHIISLKQGAATATSNAAKP